MLGENLKVIYLIMNFERLQEQLKPELTGRIPYDKIFAGKMGESGYFPIEETEECATGLRVHFELSSTELKLSASDMDDNGFYMICSVDNNSFDNNSLLLQLKTVSEGIRFEQFYPKEFVYNAFRHFKDLYPHINTFRANWYQHSRNAKEFNTCIEEYYSQRAAAMNTWTGRLMNTLGLEVVNDVDVSYMLDIDDPKSQTGFYDVIFREV